MRCPSCKANIPEGGKFCLECGAALVGRCPSCGNANPASAKFCAECGHKLSVTGVDKVGGLAPEIAAPQPSQVGSAERRQLTVMFCDLVGSTGLSSRMDPEDLREVISAYQAACTNVIHTYDGMVAKLMGDGILAYYGYPRAHEDDAERAVRSGLDIARAVEKLKTRAPEPLKVRIGIATGLVVVGDLIGSGEAQERGVVGEAPNLAARLQAHSQGPSSCRRRRAGCSAPASFCANSASTISRALPNRSRPGPSRAYRFPRAASNRFAAVG